MGGEERTTGEAEPSGSRLYSSSWSRGHGGIVCAVQGWGWVGLLLFALRLSLSQKQSFASFLLISLRLSLRALRAPPALFLHLSLSYSWSWVRFGAADWMTMSSRLCQRGTQAFV
uniref:Uncharacterized protein n=1 Tax=Zea mays TaxID=4577 RepID=C4IZ47_MAIZE|nr:unknown [Zea mays]